MKDDQLTDLVDREWRRLRNFIRRRVADPRDAEDILQDVFSALCERVWRKLPEFRWQSSFRTWAYAIARNLAGIAVCICALVSSGISLMRSPSASAGRAQSRPESPSER